jgi:hypothetical protein
VSDTPSPPSNPVVTATPDTPAPAWTPPEDDGSTLVTEPVEPAATIPPELAALLGQTTSPVPAPQAPTTTSQEPQRADVAPVIDAGPWASFRAMLGDDAIIAGGRAPGAPADLARLADEIELEREEAAARAEEEARNFVPEIGRMDARTLQWVGP